MDAEGEAFTWVFTCTALNDLDYWETDCDYLWRKWTEELLRSRRPVAVFGHSQMAEQVLFPMNKQFTNVVKPRDQFLLHINTAEFVAPGGQEL